MKNSIRLLIVCPTLSDNGLAASFRLIHLIDYWLSQQVNVIVYVADDDISYLLKNHTNYKYLKIHVVRNNSQNNLFYKIKNRLFGIPDSLIFWANKVKKEIFQTYQSDSFDAVFISSPPHSLQVIGMQIAKYFNIVHFTDFRDDWMGSHRLKHIKLLHKYLTGKIEKEVLKNSALISHAIPFVAKEWKKTFKKYDYKIFPLSNGYPNYILHYVPNSNTIEYPKSTIVYFGGAYNNFVVEQFTKLRNELIESGLSERWMIVTGGPFEIPFANDSVWIHYGNIPQDRVYDYIYNGTIHISLLPPGDLLPSRTIPLKLYTQLTTKGKCVFIGNKGATTELFKDVEGICFFDKDGWNNLIPWIKENEKGLLSEKYVRKNIDKFNYLKISKELLHLMSMSLVQNRKK